MALRPSKYRYRLENPERAAIVELVGGYEKFSDPRAMFVLAAIIDRANTQFREDFLATPPIQWTRDRVGVPPPAFFEGIRNAPPPIGQMSAVQICQRWMRNMTVIGDLSRIEGLGPFPAPRIKAVIGRDLERLAEAVDEGLFRIALVAWRRHDLADLDWKEHGSGCFRVDGLRQPSAAGLLEATLERVSFSGAHLAVFPELALPTEDFERLRAWLREQAPRYPILLALGRTHREENGTLANVGVLLNALGEILLEHRKREPYTFRSPANPSVELLEAIGVGGPVFEVIDSPVGRVALNMCRDIRSDVPILLNRVLGASLILVPAYSPRLDFALEEARILGARQRAIVCGVNPYRRDLRDGAFVYCPVRGSSSGQTIEWPAASDASGKVDAPMLVWECRIVGGRVGELSAPYWSRQ